MEIKVTIDQLEKILEYAKNRAEFGSMESYFIIDNSKGKVILEQPCQYRECNSIYHRLGGTP